MCLVFEYVYSLVCVGVSITSKDELQPLSQGGLIVVGLKYAEVIIISLLFPHVV